MFLTTKHGRRAGALPLFIGMAASMSVASAAAQLDISGNYGNAAGCAHVAGDQFTNDELFYLTPTEVATYATGCTFLDVWSTDDRGQVAAVMCAHEGGEEITLGMMRFEKDWERPDAVRIFHQNGELWGNLERCP